MQPVTFDLNDSVEVMLKMLRRLIGENIELIWQPAITPCPINMDPTQLDQILANLCVNASDAIENVGKIIIKTGIVSYDEESCAYHVDCLPGDYVQLSVSDTGCGVDQKTLAHLFEPFYTTKEVGKGTGLGLATVFGIVIQNKGFISVYSEPGVGTAFNIHFPLNTSSGITETIVDSTSMVPEGRGEVILVVEDDQHMREITQKLLEVIGYSVIPAAAPSEAIMLAKQYRDDIHLIITDVIMPEMNGRELVEILQDGQPSIRHIFMSGYAADIIIGHGVSDEKSNFIQKPFTKQSLAAKVRQILDQS